MSVSHGGRPPTADWARSAHRAALLALYAETDALLEGWQCACSTPAAPGAPCDSRCCRFGETGREPYPTAVELEEVRHAVRALGGTRQPNRSPRSLDVVRGSCPLLDAQGRCRIYASRPFGCRTFFCHGAEGPEGPRSKAPRAEIASIGRRIADLAARFDPRDPKPRPLSRALHLTAGGDGARARPSSR